MTITAQTTPFTYRNDDGREYWLLTTSGSGSVDVRYMNATGSFTNPINVAAGESRTIPAGKTGTTIEITPVGGCTYNVW
jgi:hypothetical protein